LDLRAVPFIARLQKERLAHLSQLNWSVEHKITNLLSLSEPLLTVHEAVADKKLAQWRPPKGPGEAGQLPIKWAAAVGARPSGSMHGLPGSGPACIAFDEQKPCRAAPPCAVRRRHPGI
jgi:hypothetical protein